MLGVGKGSVSQAFMLDAMKRAFREIDKTENYKLNIQEKYTELHRYFRAIQQTIQNYWPVKYNVELEKNSGEIAKADNQIIKTNGIGAFFRIFPQVFQYSKENNIRYKDIISKLKDFNWEGVDKGTGFAAQKAIAEELLEITGINF